MTNKAHDNDTNNDNTDNADIGEPRSWPSPATLEEITRVSEALLATVQHLKNSTNTRERTEFVKIEMTAFDYRSMVRCREADIAMRAKELDSVLDTRIAENICRHKQSCAYEKYVEAEVAYRDMLIKEIPPLVADARAFINELRAKLRDDGR